ncbi:uncharacterized protein BDV14DRAFT_119936 [Aspergillus stella-maris]|uniref:uncharacterized protein n=1 Tax=Aspergillus stella-maris TaxID=1810926 RepID=UPI003CCDBC1F
MRRRRFVLGSPARQCPPFCTIDGAGDMDCSRHITDRSLDFLFIDEIRRFIKISRLVLCGVTWLCRLAAKGDLEEHEHKLWLRILEMKLWARCCCEPSIGRPISILGDERALLRMPSGLNNRDNELSKKASSIHSQLQSSLSTTEVAYCSHDTSSSPFHHSKFITVKLHQAPHRRWLPIKVLAIL